MAGDCVDEAVVRLLGIFPKLFYFLPTLPPHLLRINGETITVTEPMDCVLWLLETLSYDQGQTYCRQDELEDLVAWWYPPKPGPRRSSYNFSKPINKLVTGGFIKSGRFAKNKRTNQLELTPAGQQLLQAIKAERMQAISDFLEDVQKPQRSMLVKTLEIIAEITWKRMRKEAKAAAAKFQNKGSESES